PRAGRARGDSGPATLYDELGRSVNVTNAVRATFLMATVASVACKKGGAGGGGFAGLPVEVAVAAMDTVRDEVAATGQIEAVQSIDLRPEVDGRITDFLVREGQEVEKGTPLFKVDD